MLIVRHCLVTESGLACMLAPFVECRAPSAECLVLGAMLYGNRLA
jgi:hypothetical protein